MLYVTNKTFFGRSYQIFWLITQTLQIVTKEGEKNRTCFCNFWSTHICIEFIVLEYIIRLCFIIQYKNHLKFIEKSNCGGWT